MKNQQSLFPKPPKPDRRWVIGIGEQIADELDDRKHLTLYYKVVSKNYQKAYEALSIVKDKAATGSLPKAKMARYFMGVFYSLTNPRKQ